MARFTPDQKFIVTGASSGIGEGIAMRLIADGASVIAIARNTERLNALKGKVAHPENIFLEIKDLAEDIADLPAYMKSLKERYGMFRGCVCCAGITEVKPLRALDLVEMKRLFDINYYVPIFMAKGFADRRVNSGAGASFVSIASISFHRPAKAVITYSGSKAALIASMVAIAKEFARVGVRFNTVSPSDIETPMTQDIPEIMEQVRHFYPMDFGKPEDVSAVVSFLLSDEAKWITGQNYIVDCGSR